MFAKDQLEQERNKALSLAWHTAMLTAAASVGKLPSLRELLMKDGVQTPEEQAAIWRHIGETCGRVRKHNKRRVRIIRFPRKTA